jgi:ATP-binding cassette subfamily B multidrug efflux pump
MAGASLGFTSSLIQRAAVSQTRINEFLQTQPDIVNDQMADFSFEHEIRFDHVSYCYEGKTLNALNDISFSIPKGKTVAIIGSTGSGKTTIVQLILRMMDIKEGSITIDGAPITSVNLHEYKARIGYAPQDVFMFSDTIANNISFGLADDTETLDKRIEAAAQHAALSDTIKDFSKGLDTVVGERGITLSGGQKQRVSIARAIIKDPDILIFDDCLSAVDTKTEAFILQNFRKILKGKTVVMISHRVSTVKDADMIMVLDEGRIIERGSHTELLQKGTLYATLYEKQLMEEHEARA